MLIPKIVRRRWVLTLIFMFSLLYFVANIYRQSQYQLIEEIGVEPSRLPSRIQWVDDNIKLDFGNIQHREGLDSVSNSTFKTCRNSVQGRAYITDDKGYVCEREHIAPGGCCDTEHPSTHRFVCESCQKNGCCEIYEHCVSCCLQPEKQSLLRKILGQAQDSFQHLFASVTDHFELCLAKCRTSSQSVQHENSYRDPHAKYCYGENPPDIQPIVA